MSPYTSGHFAVSYAAMTDSALAAERQVAAAVLLSVETARDELDVDNATLRARIAELEGPTPTA